MKAAHTIQTLWKHAARHLPDDVLEQLACAEDAADALRHLAALMHGLGCLISADGDNPAPAGNFQSADSLPGLFHGLSLDIATQAERMSVASEAAAILRQRGKPD